MATVIQHDAPFHQLVEEQRAYFSTGITTKLEYRRKQLLNLKQLLIEETDVLTKAVYNDLKRSSKLTYSLELNVVFVEIDYMLDNLEQWSSPEPVKKTFLSLLDTVAIVKEPLGVVLIIAPWNYPLSLVLLPLVAAMAAGNTIIVKPSEYAPFTSAALYDLFSHFFDSRFLTVVNGGIAETTNLLKERFDHILYTGNSLIAKVIMAAAAQHLTPVTLELGGKSPVIVEKDANLEVTSRRIVWGKWTNCGQTCISPDYVLVTETLKTALVNEFIQRLEEFYSSEPEKSDDYSRIINEKHFDRLSSLLARSNGQILYQGGKLNRGDLFIPPIIIAVSADDALMEDEIFGPILPIITTSGFDEAISFIRSREKPLAIYFFTRSERKVQQLYAETSSGSVTVNDVMLQFLVDTLPFGGVGQSGMGRYRGKFGFDTFTNQKALLIRSFFGDSLLAMRYPPLTDKKFKHLKLLTERRRPLPSSLPNWLIRILFLVAGVVCGVALQLQELTQEMAVDDDQKNWNKENTPLNENKVTCWQVSQNIIREIRQEVTRQVLAELTINNSDESDESDGREDNEWQQNSDIHQSSFQSQQSAYFWQVFRFLMYSHPESVAEGFTKSDFQNNETSINESREELARIMNRHERCGNASSEESEFSGEDWTFSEKMNKSPRPVQPKWKKLQWCRRLKCNSNEFCENKGRIAINEDDNEKRNCEGMEEFITPPLCTIPGIELEYKKEKKERSHKTLSKIILPKAGLSNEI